ncbi:PfkB family carbohydrate kinase [Methylocystis parvus]|uniref:Nucleoside 2-deoxyribosyltransferase n=1 Tax=Methylocystis parvus TaxID=134 RepID=A0A6B8MBC6_9HYPH|nr:PfkB family carbohydrate kinase [Methylocystis parvus]QGM99938.1 nucleoside 2-deoxyribosyltransferase [Methylocystis parvus]WBK02359.1 PfkB family carbohydrate kinase [Methylocystis parvus OBBP]
MTSTIVVAGGVYAERCLWPDWEQVFGSAGRAACALTGGGADVVLRTRTSDELALRMTAQANVYGISFRPEKGEQSIEFDYVHPMAVPTIRPGLGRIKPTSPIEAEGDIVLRFGMLESTVKSKARRTVYDPQSAFAPEPFGDNGSSTEHLAIVANRREAVELGRKADPVDAARVLVQEGAKVVVVKAGAEGAYVVQGASAPKFVPAFQSDSVWTIGSGDVFAAAFALYWGVEQADPHEAALLASKAVADYSLTRALPIRPRAALAALQFRECAFHPGRVYLAGPFFTLAQRWLVDEIKRCLESMGLSVFSPVHQVGPGPADIVASADLAGLDGCEVVFAIVDGIDSGTLFEVGYARAKGKPVYAFAQNVSDEDLKMLEGSGCRIGGDLVSLLHHLAWRV